MKKVTFSPTFQKKLAQLQKKDQKLFEKVKKQFVLFKKDAHHPSLRLHKLKGELQDVWSFSVTMDFRLLFVEDSTYYFFDMGEHDEIYR